MPTFLSNPHLTPLTGTVLLVLVALTGHRFRKAWKEREEDPNWAKRAWVYGIVAFLGLMALAFVPLEV